MPFETTTRGASGCDGKSPIGWPLYIVSVCDVVISERYFMVRRNCAQFENTAPFPPYVTSSSGNCATRGSRLFIIIICIARDCTCVPAYAETGYPRMSCGAAPASSAPSCPAAVAHAAISASDGLKRYM